MSHTPSDIEDASTPVAQIGIIMSWILIVVLVATAFIFGLFWAVGLNASPGV